jgi:hypothetical protein
METTNNDKTSYKFEILATTKADKARIIKAVKAFDSIQLVFGPETKYNQYVEIYISDPIDLFYFGQIIMVYKVQEQ